MPNAKIIAPIAGRRSSRRDDPLVWKPILPRRTDAAISAAWAEIAG